MERPPLPVTYATVAAATGTSKATVSRALRNDPRISRETCERVLKAARELGYQSDPSLAALSAYRNRKRVPGDHGKLAVLNAWGVHQEEDLPEFFSKQLLGVRERAAELGYRIELFPLPEDAAGQERLGRILFTRGIQGVLVGPVPLQLTTVRLDWSYFATATIGRSLASPCLHYAASDQAGAVEMIYGRLRELGYRRIGYCHNSEGERRGQHLSLSAYLKCLFLDNQSQDALPPLLLKEGKAPDPAKWARRHRFDAVICGGSQLNFLEDGLVAGGFSIPEDIGIVCLSLRHDDLRRSGIQEDMPGMGRAAVSLLHNMLINWERGVPAQRHMVLIGGHWQQGRTVRAVAEAGKQAKSRTVT